MKEYNVLLEVGTRLFYREDDFFFGYMLTQSNKNHLFQNLWNKMINMLVI